MPPRRATSVNNVTSPPPGKTPRKRAASADVVVTPKSDEAETVKVVVRMRPFNTKEKTEKRGPCIDLDYKLRQVTITNRMCDPPAAPLTFTYDSVHGEDTVQIDFYNTACRYLVDSVLKGFNGTIFAYGQTGCGKTWTMQGVLDVPELRGVIPNAFDHIFDHITANPANKFLVRGSYLEIYNEEVRDLIGKDSKAKLNLKEHPDKGVYVHGLVEEIVHDVDGINECMARGEKNRTVGATLINAGSSRSHSIFTCVVEEYGEEANGKDYLRAGKLNLVDLAGSETTSKTGATGQRMKEGVNINKSLSALGNVISALVDGKDKHIPYRDSKLTRLLQSSLGGNTKTLMMAAISPADYNFNETLSTLRYAARAKNIKNKAKVNEDPKDAMLREYMDEIQRLKEMLTTAGAQTDADGSIIAPPTPGSSFVMNTPAGGGGTPRPIMSADDLDDGDRQTRLSFKSGSFYDGAVDVDLEMSQFLIREGLGKFGEAFAIRGINTMEQLHQPWLVDAEGFLMDKIGMTPLEVTHFQAVMDPRAHRSAAPTPRNGTPGNQEYSLNSLIDDDSMDDNTLNLDNAFKFAGEGGQGPDVKLDDSAESGNSGFGADFLSPIPPNSAVGKKRGKPMPKKRASQDGVNDDDDDISLTPVRTPGVVIDPSEGDTVTYKDMTTRKMVVGAVLERNGDTVTVWDGQKEVDVSLDIVTDMVKAPPQRVMRTPSSSTIDDAATKALEEVQKLKEENAAILAEKERIQLEQQAEMKRRDEEIEVLSQRGSFSSQPDNQAQAQSKQMPPRSPSFQTSTEGMTETEALEAQLAAAKEFIKQNELEEAQQTKEAKAVRRGRGVGKGKGKGRVLSKESRGRSNDRYSESEDDVADAEEKESGSPPKRIIGRTLGKGGKGVKPRLRRPSTDSVTSDVEGEESRGVSPARRGSKGGKGVTPRIRRPSMDSVDRYEEDEAHANNEDDSGSRDVSPVPRGKGGKGVKPRIRRPSTDSVTSDTEEGAGGDVSPVPRGKGGKGVKPRIRRPSSDSVASDGNDAQGEEIPSVGANSGKGGKGKGVKPVVKGRKVGSSSRLRVESSGSDLSEGANRDLEAEGKKAEEAISSLWDTEEVSGVLPPPPLIHESGCTICGDKLLRKTRKHCRACGHSVCEHCSDYNFPLPKYGISDEVRCCETCAHEIIAENEKAEAMRLKELSKKNKMIRKMRDKNEESEFFKEEELKHAGSFKEDDGEQKALSKPFKGFNNDIVDVESEEEEIDINADYVDEIEEKRATTSQYGQVENLKIKLDLNANKLLQPNEPYRKEKASNANGHGRRASRNSRGSDDYSLRSSVDLSVDQGDFGFENDGRGDDDEEYDSDEDEFNEDDFNQEVDGRLDEALLNEMEIVGAAMKKTKEERRNADFVKKALDESLVALVEAEGGEKGTLQEVVEATAKFEARKVKVAARRENNKSDSCLKTHDEFGEKYRTSASVLVDDFSGKVISFDEVLFGGMDPTDHSGVRSGGAVQKRIADLRGLLKKVDTLIGNAGDMSEYKAKALIQQRETLEIELQQAMEDPEIAEARVNTSAAQTGVAPLPPAWERGVSLAVLDKFACEVVSPDSSTYDVVQSLRKSLAAVGRRTAFYGLMQDVGLKVVTQRPMRVVLEDGLEYDAEDGTIEIEMVVPAVGAPNVYICHSWAGSFEDTIMATMNWCMGAGLDPTQVFVWLDAVCLNQWTEVLGALGGVPEQAVVESFIFSIRACGNTLCVASPGFNTPDCLKRLWCAVEVYISVCVGAQTSFGVPPSEQDRLDDLIYLDLPELSKRVVHGFDIANTECTSQKDRVMLLKWVRNGHKLWGLPPSRDFHFVNRCVGSALRAFLAQTAKRVAEERGVGIGGQIAGEEDSGLTLMTGYATLLEEQGRCGVGSGKGWCFKMSLVWWLKVLRMREFLNGKSAFTAEALLHVAALLKLQGRRDDAALRLSRTVIMLREFLIGGGGCGQLGNCLVAAARCDIAIVYRDMGRLEDAITEYRLAQKDLMEPVLDSSLVTREGETVKELRGRYELMKTATNVLGAVPRGGDEGLMFESVLGIASVRVLQGQHDIALTIFNKALVMQEEALGVINESTVSTKMCIGALKNRLLVPLHSGEGLSIEGFDRTLKVYEAIFGKTHPHTISVVLQFGALLQRLNESKASLRAFARALSEYAADEILIQAELEAQTRFMEDGSFGGVSSIEHEYITAKPPAEGQTLLIGNLYDEQSLHTARDVGGQYSPLDTAACLNNMGVEFRKLGLLGEASESFARALQIKERELGEFHPSVAKIMNNYALCRWRMGHLESSLAVFLRLLDLYDALDLLSERIATEDTREGIEDFTADGQKPKASKNVGNEIGQSVEVEQAKRRHGELKHNRDILLRGVPPEDVALTLCHVALVYQQLGKPPEALDMFGRALALREEIVFEAQVHTLNDGKEGHRAGRSAADARAAQAAVASTLYNRGLIYHQVNDLLNAGGDLRRALLSSRLSCGPTHEYTADAAGALAFVARALASLVVKFARKLLEEEKRNARLDADGNIIKDTHINDGDELRLNEQDDNGRKSVSSANMGADFERAVYEAHKDECISCYECLGDHWRAVKGRGHPAAVAAFNSIAQVHKWEERKDLIAAAYTRALREGNSRVDDLEDRLRLEASFTGDVELETPEQISANAAAAEMTGRIASLREEKRAAEQRGDIKMEAAIKHEILQLQLRVIEQEEAGKGLNEGDGAGGTGRNFSIRTSQDSMNNGDGQLALSPEDAERKEKERATKESAAKVAETWGSTQILVNETKMDDLVTENWDTPEEDEAALRTRLECLKGLANSMSDLGNPEEAAAYHDRVLKLTERAVQRNNDWGKHSLVEPLVAMAGCTFSLGHFTSSRTYYERALQYTEQESGANSPDTAAALNDLAIVVRELHEDQEALQLHARAARIRQKTIGVWNATVGETLFNVSLIYKDLGDLTSAIQVCRGCCRIFDTVLGADHADTHESEGLLADLNDDYKNEANSATAKVNNFFACLVSSPPKYAEEVPMELGDNPTLRLAFRTVLEEVFEGPQDGYYFQPNNASREPRNSRGSVGSFANMMPPPMTAAALGQAGGGGGGGNNEHVYDDNASVGGQSFNSHGISRRPSSNGSFTQHRPSNQRASVAPITPLSQVLSQKDNEQNRAYTAGIGAEGYDLRGTGARGGGGGGGAHVPTATSGFERSDSFHNDGPSGVQFEHDH